MTNSLTEGSDTGTLSQLFNERNTVKSKNFIQNCDNSAQTGNMADAANEPSLRLSGSIVQSNQATAIQLIGVTRNLCISIHTLHDSLSKERKEPVIGIL